MTAYDDHRRHSIRDAVGSIASAGQLGVFVGAATKARGFDPAEANQGRLSGDTLVLWTAT